MTLEDLNRRIANAKLRIQKLKELDAPKQIIINENNLLKKLEDKKATIFN